MFNEENTGEQMVLDAVRQVSSNMVAEELASYGYEIDPREELNEV